MPVGAAVVLHVHDLLIAVPTGVKVFNWLATMWQGLPDVRDADAVRHRVPVRVHHRGLDGRDARDGTGRRPSCTRRNYIVAHFHYTMVAGTLFALFGGTYYWLPKMTGHMYDEKLGPVALWLTLIFFNLTFIPMFFLGLAGMPRRIPDYALQFTNLKFARHHRASASG